jgi:hypothetical protein
MNLWSENKVKGHYVMEGEVLLKQFQESEFYGSCFSRLGLALFIASPKGLNSSFMQEEFKVLCDLVGRKREI